MTERPFDLSRFVRAQAGVYPNALAELKNGEKRTHWMWFVFPQMLGLGLSENARLFAISGMNEARAFLDHELLGARLREATQVVLTHANNRKAVEIFGPIDCMKFKSSMTLFEAVSPEDSCFAGALAAFFEGNRDQATLDVLDR